MEAGMLQVKNLKKSLKNYVNNKDFESYQKDVEANTQNEIKKIAVPQMSDNLTAHITKFGWVGAGCGMSPILAHKKNDKLRLPDVTNVLHFHLSS